MKKYIGVILFFCGSLLITACDDDDKNPGNPVMNVQTSFGNAHMGDSLAFAIDVEDASVPLSTVKAQLFFNEEKVSETVIRTKTNGTYSGKIHVPYYANIPNGKASLKLVLQNINFTITEEAYDLSVSRPDYPYLTFVSEKGEYRMERTEAYNYAVTDVFPQKIKGYIKTPVLDENGNVLNFGWNNDAIKEGSTETIPFSNTAGGEYTITFNTFDYSASPFIIAYAVNGEVMQRVDDNNYTIDVALKQGDKVTVEGFEGFESWWIDPSYFNVNESGELHFVPIDGNYRITANTALNYLILEALNGKDLATLQADGTGAVWIIGDGIGNPSVSTNAVGWDTSKAICMAPIGDKKYSVVLEGGKTIKTDEINFKFFHQKDWGGEFKNETLSSESDLIFVGDGTNGRDPGNLGIVEGKSLESGVFYIFTVDLSKGNDKGILSVSRK
ncbi:DUF5125 domain-containing protein [Massilibacteroides sp.]|uniref:DUF5125 domain-containing protein n=1 Tax=Massilibacteroides sp. TaxID=2034766 RepID=UPI00262525EA|nr:DUF5125 domain-containing protein [Massilibacteroides sp.]MDD4514762.1 DUF5125 domain-containing protein [Massilibacteroides sp.]